jgi:signal transduction histidine kinase
LQVQELQLLRKSSLDSRTTLGHATGAQKSSFFWIAVLTGMAALLLTVGFLQYRWTNQLTEATETRIGSNVESLMLDWHLDFYQSFAAICVALQVGPDSGAHDDWRAYAERFADWNRSAAHPSLIQNLYMLETSQGPAPRLLRLSRDQAQATPDSTSERLQRLLARLEERSGDINIALRAWESPGGNLAPTISGEIPHTSVRSDTLTGWQFDQSIPAIVHPIIHHTLPLRTKADRNGKRVDWIIVVLDLPTIQTQILPEVTQRYIANNPYELGVGIGGNANRLIYDPRHGANSTAFAHPDATMNIFGPPPESTEGYFWQAFKKGNSLTGVEWHSFSGPVWFPVIRYSEAEEPWTLILQNRDGPLEAVVARLRRRNTLIGGLVLLLLAASMSVVVLASHRAQRLAKLEMGFVASVSHELRTPLSAILSAGENIADGLIDTKAGLTKYGAIITSQTSQLIDLVDQVLRFSSTRDGSQRYHLRLLEIPDLLESVRENTAGLVLSAGFTVEQEIENGLPPVMGDRTALTRCLQNLVANAVKYSPAQRTIVIGAKLHESATHKKQVRISVTDWGLGISPADLRYVFEAFYRSPQVASAQIHGTGLGLTLASEIAGAMGGTLSVESEIGKGSTFTLHLPVPETDFEVAAPDGASRVNQE